jgi:hypothetical protein
MESGWLLNTLGFTPSRNRIAKEAIVGHFDLTSGLTDQRSAIRQEKLGEPDDHY